MCCVRGTSVVASVDTCFVCSACVLFPVCVSGAQPSVRAPTGPPPTNVREVLARAAEVRSSRVAAGAASGGTGGGAQKRD